MAASQEVIWDSGAEAATEVADSRGASGILPQMRLSGWCAAFSNKRASSVGFVLAATLVFQSSATLTEALPFPLYNKRRDVEWAWRMVRPGGCRAVSVEARRVGPSITNQAKPIMTKAAGRGVREYFWYYFAFLYFGVLGVLCTLISIVLYLLLPRSTGAWLGKQTIGAIFRSLLWLLQTTGIARLDLSALDGLRGEAGLIIAPNHPCLLDAVFVIAHVPDVCCIMKAKIQDNIVLGGGARLAGYIRNDCGLNMVRAAAAEVRNGQGSASPRTERAASDQLQGLAGRTPAPPFRCNIEITARFEQGLAAAEEARLPAGTVRRSGAFHVWDVTAVGHELSSISSRSWYHSGERPVPHAWPSHRGRVAVSLPDLTPGS
jgi:hypothetical protein